LSGIRDLLLLKHQAAAPMYWLLALVITGVATISRLRRVWWWLASSLVFAILFVMATGSDHPITEALTLPWWNDAFRFVALAVFGQALLAGHGLTKLVDVGATLLRRVSSGRMGYRQAFTTVLVLGLTALGVVSNGFYSPYNSARMSPPFQESPTLMRHEQEAMNVLSDLVGPGQRVMNDPSDGSPWMWALADVRPMFARIVFPGEHPRMSQDAQTLFFSFHCLDADPQVRDVIERYDIGYVFVSEGFARSDFGRLYGMRELAAADSLDLVYQSGQIRIYRIDLSARPADSTAVPVCGRYSRDHS
jgi:hypothetical protein